MLFFFKIPNDFRWYGSLYHLVLHLELPMVYYEQKADRWIENQAELKMTLHATTRQDPQLWMLAANLQCLDLRKCLYHQCVMLGVGKSFQRPRAPINMGLLVIWMGGFWEKKRNFSNFLPSLQLYPLEAHIFGVQHKMTRDLRNLQVQFCVLLGLYVKETLRVHYPWSWEHWESRAIILRFKFLSRNWELSPSVCILWYSNMTRIPQELPLIKNKEGTHHIFCHTVLSGYHGSLPITHLLLFGLGVLDSSSFQWQCTSFERLVYWREH